MEPGRGGSGTTSGTRATVVVVEPVGAAAPTTAELLRAAALVDGRKAVRITALATALPLTSAPFSRLLAGPVPTELTEAVEAVAAAVGAAVLVVDDIHLLDDAARRILVALLGRVTLVATTSPAQALAQADVLGCEVIWPEFAGGRPADAIVTSTRPGEMRPAEVWPFADAVARRTQRRLDALGETAVRWLADTCAIAAVLEPSSSSVCVPVAIVDEPPPVLLAERVVAIDDDRWRVLAVGLASAASLSLPVSPESVRAAAVRCVDAAAASDLYAAAGDQVAAAETARSALAGVEDLDRRARLVARVASVDGDVDAAAAALVARELVDDLRGLAASVPQLPTVAALAIARLTDDEPTRRAVLARPVTASTAELAERARQRLVLDGVAPPAELGDADGSDASDLDLLRLRWGATAVRAIVAGDRAEIDRHVLAAAEVAPDRVAWRSTSRTAGALVDLHVIGDVGVEPWASDPWNVVTPPTSDVHPTVPRSVVDAHRAIALADAGRSGDALALLDVALLGGSRLTAALRRWAVAEVELAAGHPVRAMRAAAEPLEGGHGGSGDDPGSVIAALGTLASLTAAWAAYEAGEAPVAVDTCDWPSLAPAMAEAAALSAWRSDVDATTVRAAFLEAAKAWSGLHVRGAVRCRWAAGEVSRLADDLDEARTTLVEAEVIALRLGQLPMLSRIRQSLRRAGVRASVHRAAGTGMLSARETEVLQLVGKGLSTRAIAQQLGVGAATVETQVSSAVAKLGAKSRLQAALMLQEVRR